MGTAFASVYDCFLNKITDDMYMEFTPQETRRDLHAILVDAIPSFEFPRKKLNYTEQISEVDTSTSEFVLDDIYTEETVLVDESYFEEELTAEEINIIALLMVRNWLQRQVTSIENTRMKYSGSDFKFTSQANHLAKLLSLQDEMRRQDTHAQRLYKRRKTDDKGYIRSNWSCLREVSAIDD